MKVSIIMPAFNRESFIGAALRSLLRQRDAADLDILVIDDGSTDGTADVVNEFIKREPCIRLIRQDNKGISGARNTGLKHVPADADLVAFLDSDDVSCMGHLAAVAPLFRADPELALSYSSMAMTNDIDDGTLLPAPGARVVTLRAISLLATVFRKHVVDEVGIFDDHFGMAEDVDFLLRCYERPRKYVLVDEPAVFYRRHPGNTTSSHKEARRHYLRAILAHAQRRRRDPTLQPLPAFFNTEPIIHEFEPASAVGARDPLRDTTQ